MTPIQTAIKEIRELVGKATPDKLKPVADEYAKVWLVHAIKKLTASLNNPDDVACAFEISFVDGYMSGFNHAQAPTLLLQLADALEIALKQRDGYRLNYHAAMNICLRDQREIERENDAEISNLFERKGEK